jgi:nicotinamide mononucleotide transporter
LDFFIEYIELFSAILALGCVWLAAINNVANWPIAMLSSLGYILVFYRSQLYSDAFLNIIFLVFQCYGWFMWSNTNQRSPGNMDKRTVTLLMLLFGLIYWPWVVFITQYLPSLPQWINGESAGKLPPPQYPWMDAALMLISVLALIMQSKRWIEHWYLWIFVDLFYVPIYYLSGNKITAALYLLYIGLAIFGYLQWLKIRKFQHPVDIGEN